MPLLPTSTDYTDKDFDALRARLFKLISSAFPEWTDENVANFGNVLVECFAFVGDVLSYYVDNNARESRIITATQRKSLLGLCKLIGFVPSGAEAAQAAVILSIPSPIAGNVALQAGDYVATADVTSPVRFQLLEDTIILAGATSVLATVENSLNAQDTFASSGLANQEFVLSATPYLDNSSQVIAADGAYVQVVNFLSSGPADKHYVVVVDQNDRAKLRFGDGTNGAIPVSNITDNYRVGGGSVGNVEATAIKVVEKTYTDAFGTPVVVSVTNPAKAEGGADRMTNAQIKQQAPASIRAPVNTVAREDFVIHAQQVPGVARALMLTSNEDPAVPENTGFLFVVPNGGGAPSSDLVGAVLTQVTVTYPCTLTFMVNVLGALYRTINLQFVVYKRAGFTGPTVKAALLAAVQGYFSILQPDGTLNPLIDFGANIVDVNGHPAPAINWSDIFDLARDSLGVRKVDAVTGLLINGARADLTILGKEFPVLGTVTIIDGDTGLTL